MPDPARLLPHHLEQLIQGSGILPEIIEARGYQSIIPSEGHGEGARQLILLGFSRRQTKVGIGLLIPIIDRDGHPVLYQYRPDTPRIDSKGRPIKYETPRGAAMRLDFGVRQRDLIGNPKIPLWIGEGIKKNDAMRTHGFCAIALAGVWNWRGSNQWGGKVALPDWEEVALEGRDVYIAFDSDVVVKAEVQQALRRLQGFLAHKKARPHVVLLPAEGTEKVGVDDYLLTHSADELRALADRQQREERDGQAPEAHHPCYRATARNAMAERYP